MATTDAIKSREDIDKIEKWFLRHNPRMAYLLKFGMNTALRISDLLLIKKDQIAPRMAVFEQKTKKWKVISVNKSALQAAENLAKLSDGEYLFQATGNRAKSLNKPISRQYVHEQLKQANRCLGLPYNIGTHSFRKTFGYHLYVSGKVSLGLLMEIFNHSSEAITLRYIGITADEVHDAYTAIAL